MPVVIILDSNEKYLLLSATEEVYIIKNGKIVAKLTNPHQDRVEAAKSLFGVLPKDVDLNEAKEEILNFQPEIALKHLRLEIKVQVKNIQS